MALDKRCILISFLGILAIFLGGVEAKPQSLGMSPSDQYYYETDYLSDFNGDWTRLSTRLNQPKCIDIPSNLTLCRNIGYSQMRLPNLLEHDNIMEVVSQSSQWVPLNNIRCHPDTQLFLCSLFSPVCLDRTIPPCRSLCENVKGGCEAKMIQYGYPWPDMLRCDKFPLENDMCIGIQTEIKPEDSVCDACKNPETFEIIVDNYCQSDFVIKFKVDATVISEPDLKITTNRKKKVLKKGTLKKRDLRDLTLYIRSGVSCECSIIESDDKSKSEFLGMGQKVGDKLFLNFVQKYDKKDKELRKAMKAMRGDTICKEGINVITGGDGTETQEDKKADENGKERKDKNGRKKKNRGRKEEEIDVEQPGEELVDNNAGRRGKDKKRDRKEEEINVDVISSNKEAAETNNEKSNKDRRKDRRRNKNKDEVQEDKNSKRRERDRNNRRGKKNKQEEAKESA